MSTDYIVACFSCQETGPIFASGSGFYGFKVWGDITELRDFLGHKMAVGKHEGHDLRIVSEHTDLPWETDTTVGDIPTSSGEEK